MSTFAIAKLPTPVFNTSEFSYRQSTLKRDHQGLLKEIEIIAIPSTKFKIIKDIAPNVLEITMADYPSSTPLYVDSRFLQHSFSQTLDRHKQLPSSDAILKFMKSVIGTRYFWGGNWHKGIPEMLEYYPQFKDSKDQDDVQCKGLDCSGLLYQATDGFTPRNTGDLCHYGQEVEVDKNSVRDVQKAVKPLDMIVWKGHVIFVLDPAHTIESVLYEGTVIYDFEKRYQYYRDKLNTENKPFYIRRWHPDFLT